MKTKCGGKILLLVGLVIYKILLDVVYNYVISVNYEYLGYINYATRSSYIVSWLVFLFFLPLIVSFYNWKDNQGLFTNIIILLFIVRFIPTTSLMAFMPMPFKMFILYILYWLLIYVASCIIKPIHVRINTSLCFPKVLYLLMGVLIVTVLYVSGRYTGFRFTLDLNTIYDLRMEARTWNIPLIISYLLPASITVLPVLLMYFWYKKDRIIVAILMFVILFNFSINGMKSILFYLIVCFWGYYFYDNKKKYIYHWILISVILIVLSEYIISHTCLFGVVVARGLFLPAKLDYHYFDFFQTHECDYFRQSFLRWFDNSVYDTEIARLIGYKYYGNIEMNANNGLFSDAYKNLGIWGIFIFPFIIVTLFKLLNSCAKNLDPKLLILPIFISVTWFSSVSFSNVLLTNGLLLMMFVLCCLPRGIMK